MRDIHLRQTRFSNHIKQYPRHKNVLHTKSLEAQSIRMLNSFSTIIKDWNSVRVFAQILKAELERVYDV